MNKKGIKTYYIIKVTTSSYSVPEPVYIAETLEEAESHIMEYADWHRPRGTCAIDTCDEYYSTKTRRYYEKGKLDKIWEED